MGLQTLLKATADKPYDLILMDRNMLEMDGAAATERIRSHEKSQGVKKSVIIALTTDSSEWIQQEVREEGMDDMLAKPTRLLDPG